MNNSQHGITSLHAVNYVQPHLNSSLLVLYATWGSSTILGFKTTPSAAIIAKSSIATPAISSPTIATSATIATYSISTPAITTASAATIATSSMSTTAIGTPPF